MAQEYSVFPLLWITLFLRFFPETLLSTDFTNLSPVTTIWDLISSICFQLHHCSESQSKDLMTLHISIVGIPALCKVSDVQGNLDRYTDQTRHGELDNGGRHYPGAHARH
jgi:hypothetical protein